MSPTRWQLNIGKSVTLNSAGNGTVTITPPRTERWHIQRIAVVTNQASTVTTMPIASVYVDSIADANLLDSTYTGARDGGDFDIWLQPAQPIIGQWTSGVASSIATLSLFGEVDSV